MNPKVGLQLILASLLSTSILCTEAAEPQMNIYSWYDFIAPDATINFHEETGINATYDSFDNSDVMQSKVMVGRSGYDVVIATDWLLPNLIKAGVIKEIDRAQLSNYHHLNPDILAKLQANDPGNRYAIPYLWATTGIGYDADKVKSILGPDAPVNSWDLILKEENLAKLSQCGVAMLDAPGEIFPIVLHYLGLPYNSQNPEDFRKVEALLLKLRPYIRYFDSSKFSADLANGDVCVVLGWAGGVFGAQESSRLAGNGRKIIYSIPREGAPFWVENLVLLNDSPNPVEAMAFINYMLRPEVIAKSSNYLAYPNANKDATALVEENIRNNPDVYPPKQVLDTLFPLEPISLKMERVRTRLWSNIRTGS